MWLFLLSTLWSLKHDAVVLGTLHRYEAALLARLRPEQAEVLRPRVSARNLLPRVHISGNASQWDRIAFDDAPSDAYRRQGVGISVSLEFRLPEAVYDSEERALLSEARAARREQQELMEKLHALFFQASDAVGEPGFEQTLRALEAVAFGASHLATVEP